MVIIVLLKVEFTWAVPEEMFLRSRRRTRVASLAMSYLSIDLNAAVMPAATPCGEWEMVNGQKQPFIIHYFTIHPITSSCPQSPSPDPCGYGRWCACAGRGRAGCGDDASRGSNRGPSGA